MIHPIELLESSQQDADTIDSRSGFGALETERGRLPLTALDVRAKLIGLTSKIRVRQTFCNALDVPLEATYIFPLPDRAAVRSFRMFVGDREIEGQLKERAQARTEYHEAIESGHRASIAEEERPGTFSLRVGNILPKEEVSIELELIGPIPVTEGEAEFRFPLVVAPRYVPGIPLDGPPVGSGRSHDTDQVPDASRVTPPVLLPGFPNPVQLSLAVELDPAGIDASKDWASRIRSSLHSVIADEGPPWTIRLTPDERLNRDFLLRFPVASEDVTTVLNVSPCKSDKPGTIALSLVPPQPAEGMSQKKRDVVFVLDRSGSMMGWKMVAARRAVGRMIDSLADRDRFVVAAFDNVMEFPPEHEKTWINATDRNRWRTLEWLGSVEARGGTQMGPAIEMAIRRLSKSESDRERVVVLVTDGQVAGEDVILRKIHQTAGDAVPRIHTLGIDQAVNAGFLQRLADVGSGSCDLVESQDALDDAMDRIHRTIGSPVLTDVCLEPIGFEWSEDSLVPSRSIDLFSDRPVMLFGRHRADVSDIRLRVCATDTNGKPWETELVGRPGESETLTGLWGRAKVRALEDRYAAGTEPDSKGLAERIVAVSLESRVLSRFTAYVAVDKSEVVNPDGLQQKVIQPVEIPQGWERNEPSMVAVSRVSCFAGTTKHKRSRMPWRSAPTPVDGDEMLCKMSAPASASTERTLSAKVLRKARQFREVLENLDRAKPSLRGKALARTVQLLEKLARSIPESHALHEGFEDLVKRSGALLAAYRGGDTTVLESPGYCELLDSIRVSIEELLNPPGLSSDRETFWA